MGHSLRRDAGRLIRGQDGAAAIEFAIVSFALILVSLGIIEFGRALQVRNELAFAADIAARAILTDADIPSDEVEEAVREAFDPPDPALLDVNLETETVDGVEFRTLSLSYPFVLLIPQLSSESITLTVAQRVPVT